MSRSSQPSSDPALARFLRDELGIDAAPTAAQRWTFTGPVWVWRGSGAAKGDGGPPPKAAWYFVTIDGEVAGSIRAATRGSTGGFGSVRITATIGATRWQTSIFPSKDSGGYLLPLKASVRRAESLAAGQNVTGTIALG
jgi:Domain of unknown function (DUF1905)